MVCRRRENLHGDLSPPESPDGAGCEHPACLLSGEAYALLRSRSTTAPTGGHLTLNVRHVVVADVFVADLAIVARMR